MTAFADVSAVMRMTVSPASSPSAIASSRLARTVRESPDRRRLVPLSKSTPGSTLDAG
jgi:hypothetical protein